MKQGTMNILFFVLKTKLLKNGEAPVLMRITINGSYDDARIQRSVPLNLWNAAKGCSKGRDRASIALNTYIAELHARALEKHKELVLEQALITPKLILKRVFGKDTEMRTLLGTMQDGIKEMETLTGIDYSPVTINRYKNVVKKLQRLIPSYYGKEDITFHELTPEFIRAFDIYLKTEGGLCRNTIVRYMKCFKKFTNMALAKEWMRKNPFYGYKMEQDETDPVFLTYDELQAVMKKKFTIPRLELVRDIFVFACFTGLAFSDVATLSGENLVQDNLGDWWIRKGRVKLEHRRKASSISNIPLLPVPLAILEKYREHPICVKKGCCLPVMCNQKMNSYLKEIADFCGIKKNLTTHVARHTFGTTVTLANNVPLQDVSVMLGHASTRMTQHYARVMNSSLKEAMNNVKERLECNGIHINRARMDCGSCSEEIVDTVKAHCKYFYIRANRCSAFYDDMFALRGWKAEEINGIRFELNSIVVEKWKGKPYRLVIQRQRRTDDIRELWEGEYTYRCILTNDFESDIRDVVEFYNLCGGKERILDDMNNGFGWKHLPKSFMAENAVYLLMTALIRNFYKTIIRKLNVKDFGLSISSRIKTFVFKSLLSAKV